MRRIAGNDRGVDRTDRDARHPVGLQPRLVHRLVDAGLIGAERATALQHQRDAIAALGTPARSRLIAGKCIKSWPRRNIVHGVKLSCDWTPPATVDKPRDRAMTTPDSARLINPRSEHSGGTVT